MQYLRLLEELENSADEDYKAFHKKLLKNDNINVFGVRVPVLRKIAKRYKNDADELLSYPDDYYEVTFIKLTAVSQLDYGQFIKHVGECVRLIDNWAACDCFAPKCVEKHREEFLPYITEYLASDGEFTQRFALVTLLHFYVEREYLQFIEEAVRKADTSFYYVHMAAAWLIAEILVKFYDSAVEFLKANISENFLDKKTHNKAIQKACESFRLSDEQKNYLKGLKR